ncbi:MAG: endonuclease/exonuclease/phosphatase family protein [Dehalococcoidaceae bacterium]|nr:endonuclease/exonuclease/phosphatase family protein [Dehalococcoidaceae bacterium]
MIFEIVFPALLTALGLQAIRELISGLTWTLGDRFGVGAPVLGLIALIVFSSAFAALLLNKYLGIKRSITGSVVAVCIAYFFAGIWPLDPLLNTGFSIIATMAFGVFLPLYIDRVRMAGSKITGLFALGIFTGLGLDSAIHGAYGTYDIIWSADPISLLLKFTLVSITLYFTLKGFKYFVQDSRPPLSFSFNSAIPLIAIGPFLFLELQIFQNIARLATLTGWQIPVAFGWVMLGNLISLTLSAWFIYRPPKYRLAVISLLALILQVTTLLSYPEGIMAALYLVLGQPALCLLVLYLILYTGKNAFQVKMPAFSSASIPVGFGMILLVALILVYYATYQIKIPFETRILEPMAAFLVIACVLPLAGKGSFRAGYEPRSWLAPAITVILLLFSFASMVTWQPVPVTSYHDTGIKVMSYNLHNGFDTRGYLGLEELAANIELHSPDILALQEISRGWLISGRVDMLGWLSQRLGMHYVYGATAGPLWGNAILSRYEITEWVNIPLPSEGLAIERGFISAQIKIDEGKYVNVLATHFHHISGDSAIRQQQAEALLDYWNRTESTVIMGDLNASPDAPEIQMFKDAGLIDVLSIIEPPPAYTFHANEPYERIDYIWTSPEMEVQDILVHPSTASDHLSIMATIFPDY